MHESRHLAVYRRCASPLPQPDSVQIQQGESYAAGYAGVIAFDVAVLTLAYGIMRD